MATEVRLELTMTGVKDQCVYQFHHSVMKGGEMQVKNYSKNLSLTNLKNKKKLKG